MAAVIGALRADLSAGWAEFASDMGKAADSVKGFGKTFKSVASDLRGAGMALSAAITLPVAAFGASVVTASKDFEAGMNRVKAATGAAGAELDALRDKARDIGMDPKNTANAIQAADAMEILAKNGLNVQEILAGAADAATKLAAATGAQLAPAADVATDVMLQFGKRAEDLGAVVDGITGTLLASKFGFEDYALALGQAGGVAGGLGVDFNEFNAVLAATSSLFSGGSDAGTSFKTFLASLPGSSVEAKRAIEAYGLSFFDAEGNMRSMADVAGELRTKLGGLNDEAKADVLQTIFGRDAMRTAIGLINVGADGIARLDEEIQKASAQEQLDARLAGLSGALTGFSKALTELKIAIGDSGLLDFFADLVKSMTGMAQALAGLPGPVLAAGAALAGLAAVVGPVLFIAGAFMGALANLAPLVSGAGLAITAMSAAFAPLLPVLAVAALAVAALVGAWFLVKDQVLPVLDALGKRFQEVLGPTFTAIAEAFKGVLKSIGDAFKAIAAGPIGQFFAVYKSIMGGLAAITTRVLGEVLLGVLHAVGEAFAGLLRSVGIIIRGVGALLSGDFAGVLDAMGDLAMNAVDTVLNVLDSLIPGSKGVLMGLWSAISDVFVNHIAPIFAWIGDRAGDIAGAFAAAFAPAIQWAKNLYEGVSAWISDKLGPLINWTIDRIRDLKHTFDGLVSSAQSAPRAAGAPAPPVPAGAAPAGPPARPRPAPPPPVAPQNTAAGGGAGGRGRGRQGPTVAELEMQHALDVAKERGDQAAIDRAADLEERHKRIESYQKAGLSLTAATAKATAEVAELSRLRGEEYARNIARMEEGVALEVAETAQNFETVRAIDAAADLRERTLDYQREGLSLAEAERRAAWDTAQIEKARADARARWLADDARRVEIQNAQARGDEAEVERLQRAADIEARILELREQGHLSEAAARAQAEAEAATLSMSEMIGKWREFSADAARTDYLRGMAELNRLLAAGRMNMDEYKAASAGLADTLHQNLARASPMFKEWSDTVDVFGDHLEQALTPGADLNSIWESFRMELLKLLVLQPAIEAFKRAMKGMGDGVPDLGGGGGGGGGWSGILNLGKSIAGLFGGFRAKGGSIMGSKAYVVGEEGPELFAPGRAGAIIPNDALSARPARGGITVHAPITIHADDSVLAETVRGWVTEGVTAAVNIAVPSAVEASMEAVPAELSRRSRDMF